MSKGTNISENSKAVEIKNRQNKQKTPKTWGQRLDRRCRDKYYTEKMSSLLLQYFPESKCKKDYERAHYCSDALTIKNGKLVSHFCHSRLCPTCSRIKTAKLINSYGDRLREEEHLYFLTLTRPNVPGHKLAQEITDLQKTWRMITNNRWYRTATKSGLIGIRKLESTYNGKEGTYHPHYHLLLNDKDIAERIITEWLRLNPTASYKAQKLEECYTEQAWLETFKYVTKLTYKMGKKGEKRIEIEATNTILEALKGHRTIQRIGSNEAWKCAEVEEDFDDEELVATLDVSECGYMENEVFKYINDTESEVVSYVSTLTGEVLIDYRYRGSKTWKALQEGEERVKAMFAQREQQSRSSHEDILFRDWYALIPEHFESITNDIRNESEVIKSTIESRQNKDSKPIDTLLQPIENKDLKSLEARCNELWDLYSMQLFFNEREAERYKQAYEAAKNELIHIYGIQNQGVGAM